MNEDFFSVDKLKQKTSPYPTNPVFGGDVRQDKDFSKNLKN